MPRNGGGGGGGRRGPSGRAGREAPSQGPLGLRQAAAMAPHGVCGPSTRPHGGSVGPPVEAPAEALNPRTALQSGRPGHPQQPPLMLMPEILPPGGHCVPLRGGHRRLLWLHWSSAVRPPRECCGCCRRCCWCQPLGKGTVRHTVHVWGGGSMCIAHCFGAQVRVDRASDPRVEQMKDTQCAPHTRTHTHTHNARTPPPMSIPPPMDDGSRGDGQGGGGWTRGGRAYKTRLRYTHTCVGNNTHTHTHTTHSTTHVHTWTVHYFSDV